jgi:flagellar motor switch protein FliM
MPDTNEPAAGGGDVLSQSEVERLLAQVSGQEGEASAVAADSTADNPDANGPRPYDFRHPAYLTASELRRLRLRHEDFIRSLAARLSIYMRLDFSLRLVKLETVAFRKFAEGLPNPSHLSLFKVEPLRGIGILDIHPRLGLAIVDRLLGGPAQSGEAAHEFSEIEVALLDQIVDLLLSEWCHLWSGIQELRPALLGHENNSQFLRTAAHDTIMLVLSMEAKIGDCNEQMQIALPCSTIEPLVRKLGQIAEPAPEPAPAASALKWNRNFDEVPVPVTAMWDDLTLTAREVASLKPGDIRPLDPRCVRNVKLLLASTPKFEGSLGTAGGKWAVAVTGFAKRVLNP